MCTPPSCEDGTLYASLSNAFTEEDKKLFDTEVEAVRVKERREITKMEEGKSTGEPTTTYFDYTTLTVTMTSCGKTELVTDSHLRVRAIVMEMKKLMRECSSLLDFDESLTLLNAI
jgi:hypothetical protein